MSDYTVDRSRTLRVRRRIGTPVPRVPPYNGTIALLALGSAAWLVWELVREPIITLITR